MLDLLDLEVRMLQETVLTLDGNMEQMFWAMEKKWNATIAQKHSMEEFSDLSIILLALDMILNHVP